MIYSHPVCKSFTSLLFGFFFSKRLPKNERDYNIKGTWDRKGVIENENI
jgi:hypothetical protein